MRKLAIVLTITCGLLAGWANPASATPLAAGGCTGGIFPPQSSCIYVGGNGTHVTYIKAGEFVTTETGGPWVGNFTVLKNGSLFLQSGQKTEYHCGDPRNHGCGDGDHWEWTWNNGGNGWTFPPGTDLCAGFKTMSGDWFGGGPACETIS